MLYRMVVVKTFQTHLGWCLPLIICIFYCFYYRLLNILRMKKSLMYVSQVCFSTKWKIWNICHEIPRNTLAGKLIAFSISELNNLFFTTNRRRQTMNFCLSLYLRSAYLWSDLGSARNLAESRWATNVLIRILSVTLVFLYFYFVN